MKMDEPDKIAREDEESAPKPEREECIAREDSPGRIGHGGTDEV